MLMTSLQKLKDQDIEIMICTKGLVGTCRKILQDCGLLVFFSHVFGNLGDCYGCFLDYDVQSSQGQWTPPPEAAALLGTADCSFTASKGALISDIMQRKGLSMVEVIFVDDDPRELQSATQVCSTYQVKETTGLSQPDFDRIFQLLEELPHTMRKES
ncbi:unnamed protein product [Effrenium voratum]|uniref:Uncharacterized protein n=1 Tax=Effrenium voratum TaxID=2562239 RepID=A0AA36JHA5_9DINO|nr:unnamed protein product [Effrenium voratum]